MTRFLALAILVVTCACAETQVSEETQLAESEARRVAAREYPGVDIDGLADCVRKNATEEETTALSLGGTLATEATAAVLARPETADCIRDNNIELPT
ncbi:MAG: hypothetical protein KJO42_08945 [Silicimonas sp.]|nr:hypothetical protein [Silicimonas sp.]NND21741.1 hypothetical protein [Silicimonas sp.]NNL73771.1 hypothetical protein [Silicimonas sp.]RZW00147.1 MAG: hypothetical protein EX266_14250 [Paracoccaceae bacterium]